MLFTTALFALLFLPITLLGFFLIGSVSRTLAAVWLFGASVFFYGYWMPQFTAWACSRRLWSRTALHRTPMPYSTPRRTASWLLTFAVVVIAWVFFRSPTFAAAGRMLHAMAPCGFGNVHAQCLDPRTLVPRVEKIPPPGPLKRFLRNFALAQYLYAQLKLDPHAWLGRLHLVREPPAQPAAVPGFNDLPPRVVEPVLDEFFERVRPYRCGRFILVLLNDPHGNIAVAGAPDPIRDRLRAAAERNGAVFIEASPALRRYSQISGLSVHVAPRDKHLSAAALGVIAGEIAPVFDSTPDVPLSATRCPEAR